MFSELPDFLSDEECDHIIELAEMFGLEGSIMHTDEYQEKHRKEVKGTILKEGLNEVNRGGGKRRGLGPRNDVLTTCKAVTPAWWSVENCSTFPTVNIFRLFRSRKRTGRGNQKCLLKK